MKYLPLYYRWLELGHIENAQPETYPNGLCRSVVADSPFWKLMLPNVEELERLTENFDPYWASDDTEDDRSKYDYMSVFSSTRQNIVLLLAAMNGEL